MDVEQILTGLRDASAIPWAAHLWEIPPTLPYGVLSYDAVDTLAADNIIYLSKLAVRLDLYDAQPNPDAERLTESFLQVNFPLFDKTPCQPVDAGDNQTLFQTSYQFEVIQNAE